MPSHDKITQMKKFSLVICLFLSTIVSLNANVNFQNANASNSAGLIVEAKKEVNPLNKNVVDVIETKYPNGNIWFRRRYENNRQEGVSREYYENGNLKVEANFIKGNLDGVVKYYYDNGKLKAEIEHKNNVPNGIAKIYNEDGAVFGEFQYKDGKFDGACKEFYTNGKIKNEYMYANGKIVKTKAFDDFGKLKYEK